MQLFKFIDERPKPQEKKRYKLMCNYYKVINKANIPCTLLANHYLLSIRPK